MTDTDKAERTQIPASSQEWYDWLSSEEIKTVAVYHDKPALLIADYLRERAIAHDYEGREILELLQNANDQAAELGQFGRVLIDLSPEGLIIANTGLPFSSDGVASLQTSHLSPKRRRRKQLIGNKGLGFRSILNWSRTPIILSNSLCIVYCVEHAKVKLKELTDKDPELARLVSEEQQGGNALILPLLSFPLYSENGDLSARLAHAQTRNVFERSKAVLSDGYDSVIGMPFDTASGHNLASAQKNEIRPEILLFAQHLREICFRSDNEAPVTWRRDGSNEVAEVLANENILGRWRIYRTADKLPPAAVDSDHGDAIDYEIVVAVPIDASGVPGPLYSHFPTDIILPLPLVCHATLELEQNRKHIQQGRKCNNYLLGRLAEFLTEIAEYVASEDVNNPWAGCSLLIPVADYPSELKREEFPEKLIEAAKTRRIVPTLENILAMSASARLIPGTDTSWLPVELFPEVIPLRDATDRKFLDSLGVQTLDVDEIKNRIVAHDGLSTDQRISIIKGLLGHDCLREAYSSSLFIDSSGRGLRDGARVFLAPSSGEIPQIPDWVDMRFLNEDMRARLTKILGCRDSRELQQKLIGFGLHEYSLANVIRAVVAAANLAEKANPENRAVYRADLLRTVFEIYVANETGSKRPDYPDRTPFSLPNQNSRMALTTALYLGSGFGVYGEITQGLYGLWAPEKLVDVKRISDLTDNMEQLRDFLLWIGVSQWPRNVKGQNAPPMYLQHVLRALRFPVQFEEKVVSSICEATYASISDFQSIDGLDNILKNADPIVITAWLANDDRSLTWNRPASDHAKLQANPGGVYKPRVYNGPLPSFVRWRLETTSWLRSADRIPLKPKDCILGERVVEELFPRPAMPEQNRLELYGLQQRDMLEGWRRAGVLASLAYLEREEIYAKLLELPQRSPDGKLARPLYHWLLDASERALGSDGPNQKEFLERGMMWGRHGKDEGYFSITELHHADIEGLPDTLLQRLKLVDLRKRVGPEKVERLFGVKPIDKAGIQRRLLAKEIAVGSSHADTDFQMAKPYLHKLRASQTSQFPQLQTLKDLHLEVCSTLRAELTFENNPFQYDVPVWGWLIEGKTLYVRSDPAKPIELSESLLCDAIGEALASVFRIADGGDFVRMLSCKDNDRLVLLRRLRGELALEDIEVIMAEYASFIIPRSITEPSFPLSDPPMLLFPIVEVPGIAGNALPHIETPPDTLTTDPSGPLRIIEEVHIQEPAGNQQKLRVKTVTTLGGRTGGSPHQVTDGDFCERKAMEFEEACDPARWPLPVGQIMGTEGPGCDLLSFTSRDAREIFRLGPTRDLNTVERFIEVKGRGNAGASIELRGNELTAADKYGERYFLYRLFEEDDGTFELAVLQNPLMQKEALRPAVHVVMQRACAMQCFSLSGGMKKNTKA